MSFSSEIKERLYNIKTECESCAAAELSGLIRFSGALSENGLHFTTSNQFVAKKLTEDLNQCVKVSPHISQRGESGAFVFSIDDPDSIRKLDSILKSSKYTRRLCCQNSFVRGAFLGSGYISDPQKSWHLEFDTKLHNEALFLQEILSKRNIHSNITERKDRYIVYIKDCDSIADVLAIIGADIDALGLFDIQIERKMRNDINRRINFESANLNKSAKASAKQVHAVKKIKQSGKWEKLPEVLKEIGELRIENPEANLKELGEMLDPPIGKSGVNHRLNRLMNIAGED